MGGLEVPDSRARLVLMDTEENQEHRDCLERMDYRELMGGEDSQV